MLEKLICGWTSLLTQILLIVMQVQNSQSLYVDLVLDRRRPVFRAIHQRRLLASLINIKNDELVQYTRVLSEPITSIDFDSYVVCST